MKVTHTCLYVLDQDRALDFYTRVLGFEVRADAQMGPGARWLTVGPKGQPELELILMPAVQGAFPTEAHADHMRALLADGAIGGTVIEVPNIHAVLEELKAKGVRISAPLRDEPWGYDAQFLDDSGNWFRLWQKK